MAGVQAPSALGEYRIEAVERTEADVIVLRAGSVLLHVSDDPRLLDRARRLRGVEHPHLLRLQGARTLEGHAVAVFDAPTGQRLDRAPSVDALALVRRLAAAVEALEDAGAEVPPITPERVWVSEDDVVLDGLGATAHGVSAAAELAGLFETLDPRRAAALRPVLTRAREGAYLSAGQFGADLGTSVPRRRRWRR
jgi:hypothetical protein